MRMDEPAARLLNEAQREPLRAAFITRALGAVPSLAAELPESSLTQAVSAPSDYGTLLRAFEAAIHAGAGADLEGLRTQARVRGVRSCSRLLDAEGGSPLSAAEVAQLMGISRQAVDVRRKKGTLLGLETGRRGGSCSLLRHAWRLLADKNPARRRCLIRRISSPDGRSRWCLSITGPGHGTAPIAAVSRVPSTSIASQPFASTRPVGNTECLLSPSLIAPATR